MFREETVFILGAGASWHYQYPLGTELIEKVKAHAELLKAFCKENLGNYRIYPKYFEEIKKRDNLANINLASKRVAEECEDFIRRLNQVNPLVIDSFLHENKTVQNIGKLLISWVILECEHKSLCKTAPAKLKEDWGRYVVNAITTGCEKPEDLLENKVTFVTFNYDVSLEERLYQGIKPNEFFTDNDKSQFFNSDLVLHVYGKVHVKSFGNEEYGTFPTDLAVRNNYEKWVPCLDKAWESTQGIRLIKEERKNNGEVLEKAKNKISQAKIIFIFGYGFDEENNRMLGLAESLKWKNRPGKKVYFTNFDDHNRINKRAGKLFLGDNTAFLNCTIPSKILSQEWEFEKSTKSTYEAVVRDFDLLV